MSYDLRISVKIDGTDLYAQIATPECDSPTYNLKELFTKAMDWDFVQGEQYKCIEVIKNIEQGLRELLLNGKAYKQYEPGDGWGTALSAAEDLESLRDCIHNTAEDIPMEHLYVAW